MACGGRLTSIEVPPYLNDIARLDRRYTFEYGSKQLGGSSVALLAHENNPDRLQENSEV